MGADLTLAVLEMPDTEFNVDEWYLLLSAYVNSQSEDTLETVLQEHAPWYLDDGVSESQDMYAIFHAVVKECTLECDSRDKGMYFIGNRWALITGGMSWGDDPTDSFEHVNLLAMLVDYDKL